MMVDLEWGEACELPCLSESRHHYATAIDPADGRAVLIVFTETQRGYSTRSTCHAKYSHEYVSNETLGEVMQWLVEDRLKGLRMLDSRAQAVGVMDEMGLGERTLLSLERAGASA